VAFILENGRLRQIEGRWARNGQSIHNKKHAALRVSLSASCLLPFLPFCSFLERCFLVILYSLDGFTLFCWQRHTYTHLHLLPNIIYHRRNGTLVPSFLRPSGASGCGSDFCTFH
jgi:hypothetical protein